MKPEAATAAIVIARLRKDARILLLATAACALLAFLQRYDDLPARIAGCLVFGTLVGLASALLQRGAGRCRELELCEQSAPLYGRELARATALVPCITVATALASYWIVTAVFLRPPPGAIALTLLGCCTGTLIALCAAVRTGAARLPYIALACGAAATTFVLSRYPLEAAIAFCASCGFLALRQYGEALARYNPLESR